MGIPVQVTLTSSGISRAINCDYMSGKPIAYGVTGSTSGTFSYSVEAALDDIEQVSSNAVQWFTLSSGNANSSITLVQAPITAIRLNLASVSSTSVTIRVAQGTGW